jgi:hypothetical protein
MPYAFRVFGFGDLYDPQTMTLLYGALAAYMLFVCTVIVLRASRPLVAAAPTPGAAS